MEEEIQIRPFFWALLFFDVLGLFFSIVVLYPDSLLEIYRSSNPTFGPMIGSFTAFFLALLSVKYMEEKKIEYNQAIERKILALSLNREISRIHNVIRDILDNIEVFSCKNEDLIDDEEYLRPSPSNSSRQLFDSFALDNLISGIRLLSNQNYPIFLESQKEINLFDKCHADKIANYYMELDRLTTIVNNMQIESIENETQKILLKKHYLQKLKKIIKDCEKESLHIKKELEFYY